MQRPKIFNNVHLRAFFLSIFSLLFISVLFSFRLPEKRSAVPPSINFIGSFLSSFDTQPPKDARPIIHALDTKSFPSELLHQARTRQLETNSKRDTPATYPLGSFKKTFPVVFLSSPDPQKTDSNDEGEKIFQHEPLRFPGHDRY